MGIFVIPLSIQLCCQKQCAPAFCKFCNEHATRSILRASQKVFALWRSLHRRPHQQLLVGRDCASGRHRRWTSICQSLEAEGKLYCVEAKGNDPLQLSSEVHRDARISLQLQAALSAMLFLTAYVSTNYVQQEHCQLSGVQVNRHPPRALLS